MNDAYGCPVRVAEIEGDGEADELMAGLDQKVAERASEGGCNTSAARSGR